MRLVVGRDRRRWGVEGRSRLVPELEAVEGCRREGDNRRRRARSRVGRSFSVDEARRSCPLEGGVDMVEELEQRCLVVVRKDVARSTFLI